MREILFRGKRKDDGEWVEGFYTLYANNMGVHPCILTGTEQGCVIPEFVMPETVGQYTGLTDKNGTKIFEGDIILWGLAPCVAKYDTENARFMFYENGKYLKNGFNKDTMEMKEVVGNIHDNPELLES